MESKNYLMKKMNNIIDDCIKQFTNNGHLVSIFLTILILGACIVFLIANIISFTLRGSSFDAEWSSITRFAFECIYYIGQLLYLLILFCYVKHAKKFIYEIIKKSQPLEDPSTDKIQTEKIPTHLILIITFMFLLPSIIGILILVFTVAIIKGLSNIAKDTYDTHWFAYVSNGPILAAIGYLLITIIKYIISKIKKYKTKKIKNALAINAEKYDNDNIPELLKDNENKLEKIQTNLSHSIIMVILLIIYIFIARLLELFTDNIIVNPIKIIGNSVPSLFTNNNVDCNKLNNIILFVFCIIWLLLLSFIYIIVFILIYSIGALNIESFFSSLYKSANKKIICYISNICQSIMENGDGIKKTFLDNIPNEKLDCENKISELKTPPAVASAASAAAAAPPPAPSSLYPSVPMGLPVDGAPSVPMGLPVNSAPAVSPAPPP